MPPPRILTVTGRGQSVAAPQHVTTVITGIPTVTGRGQSVAAPQHVTTVITALLTMFSFRRCFTHQRPLLTVVFQHSGTRPAHRNINHNHLLTLSTTQGNASALNNCNVLLHSCQLAITYTACTTVVLVRLTTCVTFHKVRVRISISITLFTAHTVIKHRNMAPQNMSLIITHSFKKPQH